MKPYDLPLTVTFLPSSLSFCNASSELRVWGEGTEGVSTLETLLV